MGTEIGARNLADTDRYNLLPAVADLLGGAAAAFAFKALSKADAS
jgi:nitric oxide synthase oxygenase domain/subunit